MKLAHLAACAAALAAALPVHAQNMGFLRDSPIQRMTAKDQKLMMQNSTEALNRNADGETSGWSNSKTGASGTATPLRTFTQKGMKCREVRYTNHAGGFNGDTTFNLCRVASGEWKVLN
jgi:surface antigen